MKSLLLFLLLLVEKLSFSFHINQCQVKYLNHSTSNHTCAIKNLASSLLILGLSGYSRVFFYVSLKTVPSDLVHEY